VLGCEVVYLGAPLIQDWFTVCVLANQLRPPSCQLVCMLLNNLIRFFNNGSAAAGGQDESLGDNNRPGNNPH
jgi:hypothetical protein